MPKLQVALWLCLLTAGQALPGAAQLKGKTLRPAGKSASAAHAHRLPWPYVRRLGKMEVNLAIRLSSIGIRDAEPDDKLESQQIQEPAGVSHPGITPAGYMALK